MSNDELLFTVTEANDPVQPLPRAIVHKDVLWHRTAAVWVRNSVGQILCEQRSFKKDIRPGVWCAFFGEHLGPGESYLAGAMRGLREELGVEAQDYDLKAYSEILKSNKPTHREFQGCFGMVLDRAVTDFRFDPHETEALQWIDAVKMQSTLLDASRIDWAHKPWDGVLIDWLENF